MVLGDGRRWRMLSYARNVTLRSAHDTIRGVLPFRGSPPYPCPRAVKFRMKITVAPPCHYFPFPVAPSRYNYTSRSLSPDAT